jgi:hypothetical protein
MRPNWESARHGAIQISKKRDKNFKNWGTTFETKNSEPRGLEIEMEREKGWTKGAAKKRRKTRDARSEKREGKRAGEGVGPTRIAAGKGKMPAPLYFLFLDQMVRPMIKPITARIAKINKVNLMYWQKK